MEHKVHYKRYKVNKMKELEPPGDRKHDKRINLFGIRNIERYIGNSLLYTRWKTFGNSSVISNDFNNSVRVLCYR